MIDAAPTAARPRRPDRSTAPVALAALYVCSGATGLCYEVLWSRMLGVQLGVSLFGVAATVAAFMLGLGLGALLAHRAGRALQRGAALRVFALLELSVAAYALALPGLSEAGAPLLEQFGTQLAPGAWRALQGACAVALLALPATAMGASFPVVLAALPPADRRTGYAYGMNTLGAAAGAALSLLLLESLGWSGALRAVAAGGTAIAAAAWQLGRRADATAQDGAAAAVANTAAKAAGDVAEDAAVAAKVPQQGRIGAGLLLAYGGIGASALMLEIAWTRLYGMILLRTEYVLALLLAIYLLGSAMGSLAAARAAGRAWLDAALPVVACAGALVGVTILPALSVWFQERNFDSLGGALAMQAMALTLCTLPVTAALGAWLPLLARRTAAGGGPAEAARAALLYAANCAGGAAGAVATVALAIPLLGSTACVCLAAVALLALGLALPQQRFGRRLLVALLPVAAAAAIALHAFPPAERLLPAGAGVGRQLARYEDALTLHQVTEDASGQRTLLADLQRLDASTDPAAVRIQADQARLPLLVQGDPRRILFLGLGTGISASGSLGYADLERVAVELSPGAVAAAGSWFAPANGGVLRVLHVEQDDARHYLAAHPGKFDVIVGDLFHPDLAGMSNLLSVEQFARARRRLGPQGIFVQWLALNQFDADALHTVLRSFRQVYPGAVAFFDGMHLAMVGSPTVQAYGANLLAGLAGRDAAQVAARTGHEGPWTWLGRYCGPLGGGEGAVQSESRPRIEYRLARLRYGSAAPLPDLLRELLAGRPSTALAAAQLGIPAAQLAPFADAYVGAGLAMEGWTAAVQGDSERAAQRLALAYDSNPHELWVASALADRMFEEARAGGGPLDRPQLERILGVDAEHVEALRALWHLDRAAGAAAASGDLERLRALVPLDLEVRAAGAMARPLARGDDAACAPGAACAAALRQIK